MSTRAPAIARGSTQAVYLILRQRFANGEYAPAEHLTESALAAELGVSRTPVREAIRRLQADGLVVPAARGVAVAALGVPQLEQLYVLRAELEALAAALAAERQRDGQLAPSDINALDGHVEDVAATVERGDTRATVAANLELHRAIGVAAGNPFLEESLYRVWDRMAVSTVRSLSDRPWAKRITAQHRRIVGAIREGRPEDARAAAREHIMAAASAYAAAHREDVAVVAAEAGEPG